VNAFSDRSPGATTVAQRRQYYQDAFTGLGTQLDDLETRLGKLPRPPASADADAVHGALEQALTEMHAALADVEAEAMALPDSAYDVASVADGHLFAGLEKDQAIVYQALSDLSERYGTDVVPRGCGRRGAVDLSPPVTAPRPP
jgi:predicted trehalose synthase